MSKEKFIRSIRKSGTSFAINVPPEIMRILKLKESDIVRVEIERVKEK
jgi:antitoxin component of MazEF toxin-antitoxin module